MTLREAGLNRKSARLMGNKTYRGSSCLRGHSGLRRTATANCVQCSVALTLRWQRANPTKCHAAGERYRTRRAEWVRLGRAVGVSGAVAGL